MRGVYTLYEPDGALRTVEYTADAVHGYIFLVLLLYLLLLIKFNK